MINLEDPQVLLSVRVLLSDEHNITETTSTTAQQSDIFHYYENLIHHMKIQGMCVLDPNYTMFLTMIIRWNVPYVSKVFFNNVIS